MRTSVGTVEKRRQYRARSGRESTARGARVGSYAGAPIVFTSSWLVLGILLIVLFAPIARRNWPDLGAWSYVVSALVVAILGLSTLVHEMAHAIVANRAGLRINAINVTFWGGATHLATASPTPATRALISGSGPLSNLLLAAISYVLWQLPTQGSIWWALLAVLTFVNLFVGVLNLFPALPLDGGGLVEALIWAIKKDHFEASRITGRISQILGVVLAVAPFLWMAAAKQTLDYVLIVWAVILGAAMWSTGAAVRQRRRPTAVAPEIFLPALGLSGETSVADLPARLASLAQPELPAYADQVVVVVQAPNGAVTGWIDPQVVAQVPHSLAGTTSLAAVSQPLPAQATVHGLAGDSDHWITQISNLPHEVPGLVIVDDGSAGEPARVRAAVNMERLVAELAAGQR